MMETAFFISDAHLGIESDENNSSNEKWLCQFLHFVQNHGNCLYIIGDLFDFWFEYHYVVPRKYFHVLYELKILVETGIRVEYICGNHDFGINDFFINQLKIPVHRDYLDTSIDGKRFHIAHGDGLAKKDMGYRILKRILRHPLNNKLYRMIHPDLGFKIALFFSKLSRNQDDHEDKREDYLQAAKNLLHKNYDFVVFGHTHHPLLHTEKYGSYLNTGDWTHHFSYGEYSKNQLKLKYWRTKIRL